MEHQHARRQHRQTTPSEHDTPESPGGSSLIQQARAYADVARRARENCQNKHSAEQELHRRRNHSGQ